MKRKTFKRTLGMKILIFLAACGFCGLCAAADNNTRIDLLDYRSLVQNAGTETEDWQPAFQKAIDHAFAGNRILYVPAGKYPIWKTITIWKERPSGAFNGTALTLVGDGRFVTTIRQMDPEQNCVDWTGKTYKGSLSAGTIEKLCLSGGKTTLNMKWHNQFTMRSCYINGAKEVGIYAEGYSNRFMDILVRHCPKIGFKGYAHFNDITIRDGYFSRCGVGILLQAGRGVRISGIGFEHCSNTAIYMGRCMAISVVNCYFEGDGMGPVKTEKQWGFPSSIAVDYSNKSVLIEGCIFRGTSRNSGQIRLSQCENGRICNNLFQIHANEAGVMVAPTSLKSSPVDLKSVKIENNNYCWGSRKAKQMKGKPVSIWYYQRDSESIQAAITTNCIFEGYPEHTKVITEKATGGKHDASQFN